MTTEGLDSESNTASTDASPSPESAPNSQVTGNIKSEEGSSPSASIPPKAAVPKSVLPKATARAAAIDAMRKAVAGGTALRRGKGRVRTMEQVRARFAWLQAQLECGAMDKGTAAVCVQILNGLAGVLGVLKDYEFETRLAAIEASIARKGRGNDA